MKNFCRLFVEDAFLLFAWLMALANACIWQATWKQLLRSSAIASEQPTALPSDSVTEMETCAHSTLAAYFVSYTALWSVKISLLFFFRGLGHNVKKQRIVWWSAITFVLGTYAVCIGTIDYRCLVSPIKNTNGMFVFSISF